MIIEIPLKVDSRLGLNKQYSGKHWAKRKSEADEVHTAVKIALNKCKDKKLFHNPVRITLRYNSRLDCDNHGYLTKLIIDGLKDDVLIDDSPRYVRQIITEYQSISKNIIVEVEEIT